MIEPTPEFVVDGSKPIVHVMISSTSLDLPDHRQKVKDAILNMHFHPLAMEHLGAKAGSNAIKESYALVDQADVYVGIFAERYGHCPKDPVENPDKVSITELEYRRAVKRGIPILLFLAHADHPFKAEQYETSAGARKKLKKLKASFKEGDICAFYKSPDDLRAWVVQGLSHVREKKASVDPTGKPRLPVPPALYAVPNYILTSTFIGRATELDELDAWACSHDPLMVVEGIGGLGKSALTWEWTINRAAQVIPDLAGRVWWSFYERGASMSAFVRHALAYITGQDLDARKELSHYERCRELLTVLKDKPFLLVLDGFERVLTAYQRWDKAQQRDDKIEANLRECADPRDGELLQQLLHGSPSKVILSTRLFPSILEDRASARPIPGVAHHHLNGLSGPDARDFFRHAGIKGSEKAMLEFADQFGRHSLLLKVICGEIAQYPRKPFNFDAWRADPIYGGKLKLSELDLKQRYNHILRFALEGLDEQKRKLLCRIAVLSEGVTYDVLAVLNPFLPPKPEDAKPEALRNYFESAQHRHAILAFDKSLKELQDRGLLQWDRDTGHYDMHPVVRGHAADFLEESDRKQTFLAALDHFASQPPDEFDKASEISHVNHSLEIYRCLIGAGLFDEAARFLQGEFGTTLGFRLGAFTVLVELITPLFRGHSDGLPCLSSVTDQGFVLNELAIAVDGMGHQEEAIALHVKSLCLTLQEADWPNAARELRNMTHPARTLNRRAERTASLELAMSLAKAAGAYDDVSQTLFWKAMDAIDQGRFADGERLLSSFRARRLPPIAIYRHGDAEYRSCLSQLFQGTMTESDWRRGYEVAALHRNVVSQYRFHALRSEWLVAQNQAGPALDAIDEALKIVNRLGAPSPGYHDLRAWALAKSGRADDARAELANGNQRRYAAEAWLILGDREQARTCALNGYRWAWGEGPPYIMWYELERSRALLRELCEPEPQLPPFDPSKVKPIPYEAEIRAAIAKLKAEKAAKASGEESTS